MRFVLILLTLLMAAPAAADDADNTLASELLDG